MSQSEALDTRPGIFPSAQPAVTQGTPDFPPSEEPDSFEPVPDTVDFSQEAQEFLDEEIEIQADEPAPARDNPSSLEENNRIEEVARTQLGDPYLFGAPRNWEDPDPRAFDCSSFTQWVYGQATGTVIPGDTRTQYEYLENMGKLSEDNWGAWEKGDQIFFKDTYRPGISHTGIYIGDGKMIHADEPQVKISDLSDYYRRHYAGSGRP